MALPFRFEAKKIIDEGKTTQEAVDTIKKWILTTSLPQLQEEFIVLFLMSCTNDIETTKQTIEAYFTIKNKSPQIFSGWDVTSKELHKALKVVGVCIIPRRLNQNTVIACVRLKDTNYRHCDLLEIIKMACLIFTIIQVDNPPDDAVIVADLRGIGFMHLSCLKMGTTITFLEYIQEALPLKIREIHILHSNYVFDRALNLFRYFIKSELMSTIHTYSSCLNMKDFHEEWIPASHLPKDYGGDLPSFDEMAKHTFQEITNRKHQPFLDAEERLRHCYKN